MTPLEALKKSIEFAGSQEKLGKAIGYSQAAISLWLHTSKQAAAEAAPLIESAVQGAITRAQLRPDLFGQPQDQ